MAKEIKRVYTGAGVLSIREPNDALAAWSTSQVYSGTHAVKLYKGGSGNNGSTHLQITPPAGITLATFTTSITDYNFRHSLQNITANWIQMEFRFDDPNSDGWVELTAVPQQTTLGTGIYAQETLAEDTPSGYGGVGEGGVSFSDWTLADLSLQEGFIDGQAGVTDASDWILKRVRLELWEATPERTCYIGEVTLNAVVYTVEPGGTAPAMSLSSPFVEVGYTEDGVIFTYTADTFDVEVEEETFPIDRRITKETGEISCNMAETTLNNLKNAMAGAVVNGNILTLGAGVMKTLNLKFEITMPNGFLTQIFMPKATSLGAVAAPFKKGEKTIWPVTFQALKPANEPAVTIIENAA